MNWINDLLWGEGIGHSILLLSFVIAAGIQLGKIKVFGVSLGITLVLFVGIILGHFGFTINHNVLHFFKEFGLSAIWACFDEKMKKKTFFQYAS